MSSRFKRDKALSFHWSSPDCAWTDCLGLPPPKNESHAQARNAILTEAVLIGLADSERYISYSRREGWYSGRRRYLGTAFTYQTVPPTIDLLTDHELLIHDRAPPGRLGWQSRFKAAPALLDALSFETPVEYEVREIIRLKDENKHLIDYPDTDNTTRMRRQLHAQNEALASTFIDFNSVVSNRGLNAICIGKNTVYPAMKTLFRVFNNGRFAEGGRMYGPFWQNLPKADRKKLKIDELPVVEMDYSQMHPHMLYAEEGESLTEDAYTLKGWERGHCKRAFNIAVNANCYRAAVGALAQEIGDAGSFSKSAALIDEIKIRHAPIAKKFHSGLGVKLQRADSDIAIEVCSGLRQKGIVALPVHDSFIVQRKHKHLLIEQMEKAFFTRYSSNISIC